MADALSKSFIFDNTAGELYPLTMDVIDFLRQDGRVNDALVRKLKLVLMELLTNSLKHSGGEQNNIQVEVFADEITIIKSDKGNTLKIYSGGIKYEWPLPGNHQCGRTICIYSDGTANINGVIKNNCSVQFLVEDADDRGLAIESLPEHFGLMIIARACNTFSYEFDIDTCTNKFIATIALINGA
jgi:two-component sensor histidine kinase